MITRQLRLRTDAKVFIARMASPRARGYRKTRTSRLYPGYAAACFLSMTWGSRSAATNN